MSSRRLALLLCALAALATPVDARGEATAPPATGRAAEKPATTTTQLAQDRAFLIQLGEAQRALSEQLEQLKERIDWLYYEVTLRRDEHTDLDREVRAMRDEVKGLYVESSTVKQQIDALKEDIAGVNSNVSGFRTFSGLFIAMMLLLLAFIFVMTIRR